MCKTEKTDPSYGLIEIVRVNCHPSRPMFGSNILHNSYINIKIYKAKVSRDLSNEWYFARDLVTSINLTANQFVELLTAINVGGGITCTIEQDQKGRYTYEPDDSVKDKIESEFKNSMKNLSGNLNEIYKEFTSICEDKRPTKKELRSMKSRLELAVQQINNSLPFVENQFARSVDKIVVEAKGEIESFFNNILQQIGLDQVKSGKNAPELLLGLNNEKKIGGNDEQSA